MIRAFGILLLAACAGAQTAPENLERIEVLESIDGVDSACWNNDGSWDPGASTCVCDDPLDIYTPGVGCDPAPPPDPLCPNGVIDVGETCDGSALNIEGTI